MWLQVLGLQERLDAVEFVSFCLGPNEFKTLYWANLNVNFGFSPVRSRNNLGFSLYDTKRKPGAKDGLV
jgi:hypothetical protein